MKKYIGYSILALALSAGFTSCGSDFLDNDPHQQVDTDKAITSAAELASALNGIYYQLGRSQFVGRNLIATGDVASDNSNHSGKTSHFYNIFNFAINENNSYLSDMWETGYKIVDFSTRAILAGNKILAGEFGAISEADKAEVYTQLGQAYGLKAYATFMMANVYALPYNSANANAKGLVLVNEPIKPFEKVSRASLQETYDFVLDNITKARECYAQNDVESPNGFYMSVAAVEALAARVNLYMENFDQAASAAQKSIDLKEGALIYDAAKYAALFDATDINSEDIFVVGKAANDNLSANSLNTLWSNYGVSYSSELSKLYFSDSILVDDKKELVEDIRLPLVKTTGGKYKGLPNNAAVSNIPVFRLPEMYLILAEAKLAKGDIAGAQEALLVVAKRNPAIEEVSDLPATKDALLAFIIDERRRELYQEGHRLFDARRLGLDMKVTNGTQLLDAAKFVFPIPNTEINSGMGVEQNEGWSQNLPTEL
ncbi:MAG: RagB/SusD family nutrient uptake outer membrane protein [Tannerellaceae bacterium]